MPEVPFLPSPVHLPGANIRVVGVGGAGCNAIERMIQSGVGGVQFISMNTDQQSLAQSGAHVKLPLGPLSMRGLGAGGNAERGAVAAEESREDILASLQGADMVFITAGMGGGTGTGAGPVVASCAREIGALAVAVVLTPFSWEGPAKAMKAEQGLENLRGTADTVIVVSNEKLAAHCERRISMKEAFQVADSVLIQGVRGIADLILRPGQVNCDFADVEAVLRNGQEALIGTGQGRGEEALLDALQRALDCPLLERAARGPASQVIVSAMADWGQVEFSAVGTAMRYLQDHFAGNAEVKLGQVDAPELEDRVLVTVLASGFLGERTPLCIDMPSSLSLEAAPVSTPHVNTGPVYGEVPAAVGPSAEMPVATPTRLLPQGPTPSTELDAADDLHVPAIIRMSQGRLPIE